MASQTLSHLEAKGKSLAAVVTPGGRGKDMTTNLFSSQCSKQLGLIHLEVSKVRERNHRNGFLRVKKIEAHRL